MKGNTKQAVIFSAVGAAAGFGAAKLLKVKKPIMIMMILGLAAVGGAIGYKQ